MSSIISIISLNLNAAENSLSYAIFAIATKNNGRIIRNSSSKTNTS